MIWSHVFVFLTSILLLKANIKMNHVCKILMKLIAFSLYFTNNMGRVGKGRDWCTRQFTTLRLVNTSHDMAITSSNVPHTHIMWEPLILDYSDTSFDNRVSWHFGCESNTWPQAPLCNHERLPAALLLLSNHTPPIKTRRHLRELHVSFLT